MANHFKAQSCLVNNFKAPILVWPIISKPNSHLTNHFKAQFLSGKPFQSPLPIWKIISKSSSHLENYFQYLLQRFSTLFMLAFCKYTINRITFVEPCWNISTTNTGQSSSVEAKTKIIINISTYVFSSKCKFSGSFIGDQRTTMQKVSHPCRYHSCPSQIIIHIVA